MGVAVVLERVACPVSLELSSCENTAETEVKDSDYAPNLLESLHSSAEERGNPPPETRERTGPMCVEPCLEAREAASTLYVSLS